MSKKPSWIKELAKLNPCKNALEWAAKYPTAEEAWAACERGDRMFWYAARVNLTPERHRQLVIAICRIVERHLDKVPAKENRPRVTIETALAWAAGNAALQDVQEAAWAAWAAGVADEDEAAGAAEAVAYATWAAARVVEAAAWAAKAAAYAAWAAAWAAVEAEAATKAAEYKAQAEIIRQHLTCP